MMATLFYIRSVMAYNTIDKRSVIAQMGSSFSSSSGYMVELTNQPVFDFQGCSNNILPLIVYGYGEIIRGLPTFFIMKYKLPVRYLIK